MFENLTVNEGENAVKQRRSNWSCEEDMLLISAWLHVSKDPIVGTDQKGPRFWLRIWEEYDANRGDFEFQTKTQVKNHYGKMSSSVIKFNGIYKRISDRHPSGWSESQIMAEAHAIYKQEKKSRFTWEHAWRVLKEEPKWRAVTKHHFSKRTKTSEFGAYTSSSNPETPTSCENDDGISTPLVRPMGQKAAKRKAKAKVVETSADKIAEKIDSIKEVQAQKLKVLAEMREDQRKMIHNQEMAINYEILMKDTSGMTNEQRENHEKCCKMILDNMNM